MKDMGTDDELKLNPKRGRTGNEHYAILRIAKLKAGNFTNSVRHSLRDIETPNADKELRGTNVDTVKTTQEYKDRLQSRLSTVGRKIRNDAVVAVEYLITASPEIMAKLKETKVSEKSKMTMMHGYFGKAMDWIDKKHGKENILGFGLHMDEGTPHLYCYVTPITKDGRLSARDFFGGKQALSQMQTDFAEKVGKDYGLERGVQGSRAHHRTIKSFYHDIEKTADLMTSQTMENPAVREAMRMSAENRMKRAEAEKTLARIVAGDVTLLKQLQAKEQEKQRGKGFDLDR